MLLNICISIYSDDRKNIKLSNTIVAESDRVSPIYEEASRGNVLGCIYIYI